MRLLISSDDLGLDFVSSSRVVLSAGLRAREFAGLGALRLSMEEMLLFTECPLAGDVERSVSEEIVESGRGMYWTVSENPTMRRDGGLSSPSSDCGSVVCNVGTLVSEAVARSGDGGSCVG